MTIEQAIGTTLQAIKELLGEIRPLRESCAKLAEDLRQVQEAYTHEVGPSNEQARLLAHEVRVYEARLRKKPDPPRPPTGNRAPPVQPPPESDLSSLENKPPAPPAVDWRADQRKHKENLANYIDYFIDPTEVSVRQAINAAIADDSQHVGHMLERIPWDDSAENIWSKRLDWESAEEQHKRLTGWYDELGERLRFWQNEENRMKQSGEYELLQEKQGRDDDGWRAYLGELAAEQRAEIKKLEHRRDVLHQATIEM